jgi:hypothetical protein
MPATPLDTLPAQLVAFVEHFAVNGDGPAAAVEAGVHPNRAKVFARVSMANPAVRAGYEHVLRTRFAESGPLALNLLLEMVVNKDKTFEPRVRLEAAKTLLDRSGYTAKDMRESAAEVKDLKDMTRDELLLEMDKTERELADRATLVEVAPNTNQYPVQVVDMEG